MELKCMTKTPLNPALVACPNCSEAEQIWIHSQKGWRYHCYHLVFAQIEAESIR